jgi:hypothetical protein
LEGEPGPIRQPGGGVPTVDLYRRRRRSLYLTRRADVAGDGAFVAVADVEQDPLGLHRMAVVVHQAQLQAIATDHRQAPRVGEQ